MDLFDVISNDIKEAMKAKDKVKLETLRNVKKFFLEAKTAPGANDTLTDDAALKIMQKLVKQGKDSAAIYQGQGRADLAEAELAQVAVLEAYLPARLSAEEIAAGAMLGHDTGVLAATTAFGKTVLAAWLIFGSSGIKRLILRYRHGPLADVA